MENIFTPQFFTQGGIAAIVFFFGYKAIIHLYTDMRKDSLNREEVLMKHLDKVSCTLERIDKRMSVFESRMTNLEKKIGGGKDAE
jgi:hypothetical protein